jgi:hypothetical protein
MMSLVAIDEENISGFKGIESVINQKFLSTGYGIIYFTAIVYVHFHSMFRTKQMSH